MNTHNWYFTADYHFDHSNIIKYANRPFESVVEMNETLIANTNRKVRPGDNLVILGDITLHHDAQLVMRKFLSRLNGNKIIVKGNHDYWIKNNKRYMYVRTIRSVPFVMTHYPLRQWPSGIQLHGHSHGNLVPHQFQWDVGVDNNDYFPVSINEVLALTRYTDEMLPYQDHEQAYLVP